MVARIDHIALVVRDPERTVSLFKNLFGALTVIQKQDDDHEETMFQLGQTWFVLVQADLDRSRTGDHIAFSVSKSEFLTVADKLRDMNVEFFLARSDTALYFFDYDNHVFELDTIGMESMLES